MNRTVHNNLPYPRSCTNCATLTEFYTEIFIRIDRKLTHLTYSSEVTLNKKKSQRLWFLNLVILGLVLFILNSYTSQNSDEMQFLFAIFYDIPGED